MIPLRDNIPTRRFPVVCVLLILANLAIFIVDQLSAVQVRQIVQTPYGPRAVEQAMGGLSFNFAMIPALVSGQAYSPNALHPAWLTVFTSMFLHANWLHLGGNMLYLWIFGNNIEDVVGRGRFILFYFLCGIGAAALHISGDPSSTVPTVGASGAIAGVMGAYIWLYPNAQILSIVPIFGILSTFLEIPAYIILGYWFLLQFINARWLNGGGMLQRGGGVAYLAHVGGFVTGMLLIVLLGGRKLAPPPERQAFDDAYENRWWR